MLTRWLEKAGRFVLQLPALILVVLALLSSLFWALDVLPQVRLGQPLPHAVLQDALWIGFTFVLAGCYVLLGRMLSKQRQNP